MKRCPHCPTSIGLKHLLRSTRERPYVCPTCQTRSLHIASWRTMLPANVVGGLCGATVGLLCRFGAGLPTAIAIGTGMIFILFPSFAFLFSAVVAIDEDSGEKHG
jgi:hypothetical protein